MSKLHVSLKQQEPGRFVFAPDALLVTSAITHVLTEGVENAAKRSRRSTAAGT